jgi:hypothetical protein
MGLEVLPAFAALNSYQAIDIESLSPDASSLTTSC